MKSDSLYTLDELSAQVALALAENYDGAPNDRIRELPDRRTIRYYTTLGLLDRPQIDGRIARYRRRHLLQLVAIKRLQGHGLSLHEIQQRLLGVSDRELEKTARLPSLANLGRKARVDAKAESPKRREFWKEPPSAPSAELTEAEPGPEPVLAGLRLSEDVTLLLPLARAADEADLQAVQAAAAPLLKLLRVRRLLKS
ncbi:MAG TPA: MerR family transcriptional regulator [Gemmataceae bacterium]|nr:MerR family transcriptional regulator [Gemmataceae bacterium]